MSVILNLVAVLVVAVMLSWYAAEAIEAILAALLRKHGVPR